MTAESEHAERLRQERDLVDAVIQATGSLVMVTDRNGHIVRFNRACEALSGYSAGDVEGRLCWEVLVPPEASAGLLQAFARLAPDVLPFSKTDEWVTRLGERVLIEWSGGAILDDSGNVSHVVFSGVDVTHRRRTEDELRASEARLRLLADHTTELVSTYEPETGTLTYASPSWRSLGYDPSQLIGMNVAELTHPDDLAMAATLHAKLLAEGGSVSREGRIRTADGEWRWFEALAQLVRDSTGAVKAVQVSCRDVSRRRETEQELVRRALHDPLTGLPNRALFHDRLETALRRAVRQTGKVALLFCDLDRFKLVNDTYGHPAGDAVLQQSASRLQAACRPEDTVARLGGDEFVVLAEGVEDESVTERLAKRIVASLEEPIRWKDIEIVPRVSVGVATASETMSPEELLVRADQAMYCVKRAHRGRS